MENFHPVSVLLGDIIMRPGKPVDRDVKEFTGHTRQHWRAQLKVKEQVVTYAIVVFSGVCPGDVHAPDEVGVWMFLEKTMDIIRSEEHTSELQSLMRTSYAVFCLKKKKNTTESQ